MNTRATKSARQHIRLIATRTTIVVPHYCGAVPDNDTRTKLGWCTTLLIVLLYTKDENSRDKRLSPHLCGTVTIDLYMQAFPVGGAYLVHVFMEMEDLVETVYLQAT